MRAWGFGLSVFGLFLDIIGAWILTRGLFITKEKAVYLTATRFAGDTLEQNLKHPQAQDRLKQSRAAKWGLGFLGFGFGLQLLGATLSYLAQQAHFHAGVSP